MIRAQVPKNCGIDGFPNANWMASMRAEGLSLESLIEEVISSGQLIIEDDVRFESREGHLKCRLSVRHQGEPERSGLRLEIVKSVELPSFSLIFLVNSRRVRCYCSDGRHTNPADCISDPGKNFNGYHKHLWSDQTGDDCVYIPDDIPGSLLQEAFYQFCDESGITFVGIWNDPPPVQLPMLGG